MDPWYRVVTPRREVLRNLLRVEQDQGPDFLRLANALSALYREAARKSGCWTACCWQCRDSQRETEG